MQVALYARVSTEEQVGGYSIEGQLDTMQRYAEQHGWHIVERYVDAGFSARTDNRPAFKRMVADAKLGRFGVILVLRGDRFARNRLHAAVYKQLLKEVGVRVVSVTEPVEEGTPAGVILEGMNEVIAEWYSVDLSVKIAEAKRRRAEKGLWNGPVPFGYAVRDGLLAIVAGEAEVVKEAFEKYASGRYTYQQIATWLNGTKHRPRVHLRERKGREHLWSKDTVKDMLRNPFYLGQVKHKERLLPGKHPAIVSQELFDRAQVVRKEHRRGPWTYTPRHRTYLLGGLARCAACGTKLWAQHLSGKDYYREETKLRGLPCGDGRVVIRADVIEGQVENIIRSLRLPESWRNEVQLHLSASDERKRLAAERQRLEDRKQRLWRAYLDGMPEAEYRRELAAIEAALKALRDTGEEEVLHLGDHVEGMLEAWQHATKEEKRDLLRMMLDGVYVDTRAKNVVALQVKPAFKPLFRVWLHVPNTGKSLVRLGSPNIVHGDPDGI